MTNLNYVKDVKLYNSYKEYILDKTLIYHCLFIVGKEYYYIDMFKNKTPIDYCSRHFYIYNKNLDKLNQEYRWSPCTPVFTSRQLDNNYSTFNHALKFNYFMEQK